MTEEPVPKGSANLQDLRAQLTRHTATLTVAASCFALWWTLPRQDWPVEAWGLLVAVAAIGLGVRRMNSVHPRLTRYGLVAGLVSALTTAIFLFPFPWLPFLGLGLVPLAALLVSAGEIITIVLLLATALVANLYAGHAYPLTELAAVLCVSALLARLMVQTLYTALEWAWAMWERNNLLLNQVRENRAQLGQTNKSLELAYDLQQRTQRELVVARKQADEARRVKEQFIADISHELRTPLNLIVGFSDVMYYSPQVYGALEWPRALRQDVYQINRNSRHLLRLIDDILDLSRFDMTSFVLRKENTDLTEFLQETADIAASLFQGSAVQFHVQLPPHLPVIEIDRTRLRQVLLNLLKNAQRFTEQGRVLLAAANDQTQVVISVQDTGPGIPAQHVEHVFDEFYQVDSSLRKKHEGAGLGLAISKRFVQAHGGRIWVDSTEGAGSTFSFALPVSPPLSFGLTQEGVPAPAQSAPPTLLVVDSDPAVTALLERRLGGYTVVSASPTDTLAEQVLFHHPRAVLYNVAPGARARWDALKTIAVPQIECSLPSQEWLVKELQVTACLSKPFTAQQLLLEISRVGNVRDILIADDDRGFVQLVERLLQASDHPFHIRRAYDGTECLAALRAERPDLLLLDLTMPSVSGWDVLAQVRQEQSLAAMPVILLTAVTLAQELVRERENPVRFYRPGGLTWPEVLDCVRAVVEVIKPRYDETTVPPEALAASH